MKYSIPDLRKIPWPTYLIDVSLVSRQLSVAAFTNIMPKSPVGYYLYERAAIGYDVLIEEHG